MPFVKHYGVPRNGFLVFFPPDLGFLMSSGFLGIFWAKSDKIWVSEALRFSPHFITSLLTTLNLVIFILLLFHLFRTTSAFSLWH